MDENAQVIYQYLRNDMGLSHKQAVALMGSLSQESRLDPQATNGDAFGVAQWTGGRKANLLSFTGGDTSLKAQLDYLRHEVTTDPYESQMFNDAINNPDQSIEGLTVAIRKKFERAGDEEANDSHRIKEAYRFDSMFKDTDNTPSYMQNVSDTVLDWNNLIHNRGGEMSPSNRRTDGQKYTDTDNLRPESKFGLNILGQYMRDQYGSPLTITGGAETWTHEDGEYSHHSGWKADVVNDNIIGGTKGGDAFQQFCNMNGWSAVWEENHWDIDFSGHDTRNSVDNSKSPYNSVSGNFFDIIGFDKAYKAIDNEHFKDYTDNTPVYREPYYDTFDAMSDNFLDSVENTGSADAIGYFRSKLFHTSWFTPPTQFNKLDEEQVSTALNGNKELVQYVLSTAHDREEMQYLTKRIADDQKRKADIQRWKEHNDSVINKALVALSGAGGLLVDPLVLVPVGEVSIGVKAISALGETVSSLDKIYKTAKLIAPQMVKSGAINVAQEIGDTALRNTFGENKQSYTENIGASFILGSLLGGGVAGHALYKANKTLTNIESHLLRAEDNVIRDVMTDGFNRKVRDFNNVQTTTNPRLLSSELQDRIANHTDSFRNETKADAMKLHNENFKELLDDVDIQKYIADGRVVVSKLADAKKLVKEKSGRILPNNVKAMYVPNEDYAIVIGENVTKEELKPLLQHEFAVHARINEYLTPKQYKKLMEKVNTLANAPNTPFNEIRSRIGTYDPEEIFAEYVATNPVDSKLFGSAISAIKKKMSKSLGDLDLDEVVDVLREQGQIRRSKGSLPVFIDDDGVSAFAGVRFSRDDVLNPKLLEQRYMLESDIRDFSQTKMGTGYLGKPIKYIAQKLEQGVFGRGINSPSNTLRTLTSKIFDDAQGRGLGNIQTLTVDTNKYRIKNTLARKYLDYTNERFYWARQQEGFRFYNHFQTFDKMVADTYSRKYGYVKSNALENVPPEVERAVEHLHDLKMRMVEHMKTSASALGLHQENLLPKEFQIIGDELWRTVKPELKSRFIVSNFVNTHDELASTQAYKFFTEYYTRFANRDIIKQRLEQKQRLENPDNLNEMETVDSWLKRNVKYEVEKLLQGVFSTDVAYNTPKIGSRKYISEEFPLDVTGVLKMPNGKEFSFDKAFCHYDFDETIPKILDRFSGDVALSNIFKTQAELDNAINRISAEINTGINHGNLDISYRADVDMFKNAINDLRGIGNVDNPLNTFQVGLRLAQKYNYIKNGANMGFNQIAEVGSTIAYGGVQRLFGAIPFMRDFAQNVFNGTKKAQLARDLESYLCGTRLESDMFTMNYKDYMIHNALSDRNNLINDGLTFIGDVGTKLSKITTGMNMMPILTNSMVKDARVGIIIDSLNYAIHGSKPFLRNPFSKTKLRSAHITDNEWERIQENIRKYATLDNNGNITSLDIKRWEQEKKDNTLMKWYNLIQKHAERAVLSDEREGNKNLTASSNEFMRLLTQFKDSTFRALSASTLRSIRSRELDDGLNVLFTTVSNIAVYMARVGIIYGGYKAVGLDEKAEKFKEQQLSKGALYRVAATRSAPLTPFSLGNDVYEMMTGAPTIRTTVDRDSTRTRSKDRTIEDIGGDLMSQIPAVNMLGSPLLGMAQYLTDHRDRDMVYNDYKNLYKLLPIPNWIYIQLIVEDLLKNVKKR